MLVLMDGPVKMEDQKENGAKVRVIGVKAVYKSRVTELRTLKKDSKGKDDISYKLALS